MKKLIFYTANSHVRKHWENIKTHKLSQCYDLNLLRLQAPKPKTIIFVHLTELNSGEDKKLLKNIAELVRLDCYIIVFSNVPSAKEGSGLFRIGIKGYLNTFSAIDNINQVIEVVAGGNIWLGQQVLNALIVNVVKHSKTNQDWKKLLTAREVATAEEVLQGNSNREIASNLEITERTVKSHISKLFEKLDAKDRLNLVLKIQNWGK